LITFASGGVVNLTAASLMNEASQADVSGNGVTVNVGNGDALALNGAADIASVSGANGQISIGGNGQASTSANADWVIMASGSSGATVNLLANSQVDVQVPFGGSGTSVNDAVNMAANDTLLTPNAGLTINAPAAAGSDVITYFTAGDALQLNTHFASIAALISATTFSGGNSSIHLDTTGDSVTLTGASSSQFATFANAGNIKFI
jgi:hypothetical protein